MPSSTSLSSFARRRELRVCIAAGAETAAEEIKKDTERE